MPALTRRAVRPAGSAGFFVKPSGLGIDVAEANPPAAAPGTGDGAGESPPRFEMTLPLPRQGIHSRGP